jgi:hypothetical protein
MKRLLVLLLLSLLAAAAPAGATERSVWATVNVCDTAAHPDEIGIRAAVPERRSRSATVRFRVQYRDLSDGRWRYVRAADSGWHRVGRPAEVGWSFEVAADDEPILRGVVLYRWSRRGRVVRRARRVTEGGHRSTAGADPRGFSAATCRIEE